MKPTKENKSINFNNKIYSDYLKLETFHSAAIANVAVIIGMLFLLIADRFLFTHQEANFRAYFRCTIILISLINLNFAIKLKKSHKFFTGYILCLIPALSFNFLYIYLLAITNYPSKLSTTTFIGAYTTFLFTFWLSSRLWPIVISFIAFYSVAIAIMLFYRSDLIGYGSILYVGCSVALVLCYFISKKEMMLVENNFINWSRFLSNEIAYEFTVDRNLTTKDIISVFPPQKRFIGFLSSDWRGYQAMTYKYDNHTITDMLSFFYRIVGEELSKLIPSGDYYWDWQADQLTVLFYSKSENEAEVSENMIKFSLILAGVINSKISDKFGDKIKYDIGISSGICLCGVIGPTDRLKTTALGDVPGIAARLESEAKDIRKDLKFKSPSIVMTEELFYYLEKKFNNESLKTRMKVSEVKDVKGKKIYFYNYDLESEISDNKLIS